MRRLEMGEGATLDSLLRVLIYLDLEDNLKLLIPDVSIRPIERVQFGGKERQRARPKKAPQSFRKWEWGE